MLLTSQLVKASVGDAFVILPFNAVICRRRCDRRRSRPQRQDGAPGELVESGAVTKGCTQQSCHDS